MVTLLKVQKFVILKELHMLHELKKIIHSAKVAKSLEIKTVLASVVALEGSSYRRPGVRMSVQENGIMIGAVSGGCVEKEISRQAQKVFETNRPLLMEYDGRYRLGCDGILYILIEPFSPDENFYAAFEKQYSSRKSFAISSYYSKKPSKKNEGGSYFFFSENQFSISETTTKEALDEFHQTISPGFKIVIIGTEHDAVELCSYAAATGWEVDIVSSKENSKTIDNFPGATNYLEMDEKELERINFDSQTAVLLMTHNYARDLKYLSVLTEKNIKYIGLLGPRKRREKLLNDLFEKNEWVSDDFLETIFGPTGINIGAETPQEIAISILAEVLSVFRSQKPISLKDKQIGIHQ